MTWVIGSPTTVGYSVILADIQVTVGEGTGSVHLDGIQKVFPVGRYMAAGFAGDVYLGYRLIEDLTRCLELPADAADKAWIPAPVIDEWRHRARSLFEAWGGNHDCGVDLLVAGVWKEDVVPSEADLLIAHIAPPGVHTYACILRSPTFDVEVISPMRVKSIGSGNDVDAYVSAIEHANRHPAELYHGEFVAGMRGSLGTMLAHTLGARIARTRVPGISEHLLVCVVEVGAVTVHANDSDLFVKGERVPQRRMPLIATSWTEVLELLQRHGLARGDSAHGKVLAGPSTAHFSSASTLHSVP